MVESWIYISSRSQSYFSKVLCSVHPLRVNNKAIVMGAHDGTEYRVNVLNTLNMYY